MRSHNLCIHSHLYGIIDEASNIPSSFKWNTSDPGRRVGIYGGAGGRYINEKMCEYAYMGAWMCVVTRMIILSVWRARMQNIHKYIMLT